MTPFDILLLTALFVSIVLMLAGTATGVHGTIVAGLVMFIITFSSAVVMYTP